ncbi:MAG: YbhB/YbcL family Raf kinase inhibitor-like protein [Phycisphaerae bacterium]|nr:YbhB/YbcL family Raf kinase inhibitor-like protein [Gemmatimonadaceae bacterium]
MEHSALMSLATVAIWAVVSDIAFAQNPPARPPAQPTTQPAVQPGGRGGGGGGGRGAMRIMSLVSPAFTDGGMIPMKHAQAGHDVSPPLAWTGAPDSTRSFVLIVHDADAAIGDGTDDMLHWMVWNIPGTATSLAEGIKQGSETAALRQISGTGPYYRGPAAPSTGPAHHYVFELYALDAPINVAAVGQSAALTRAAVMDAMRTHIRGKAVLVGLYKRPAP